MDRNIAAAVRAAVLPFLLSRILVAAIVLTGALTRLDAVPAREGHIFHTYTSLGEPQARERLKEVLLAADAVWYLDIARNGYSHVETESTKTHYNWVFFPLLPLFERFIGRIIGSPLAAGVLISNIAFFCALCLLYLCVRRLPLGTEQQHAALWFCAFFPTSHFYAGAFSESLFFVLVVGWLLLLEERRIVAAAALFSLSGACRPTALLLFPAFFAGLARHWKHEKLRTTAAAALAPLGLLLFMLHLWMVTGDPLAFITHQAAWGRLGGWHDLYKNIAERKLLARDWSFDLLHVGTALFALFLALRFAVNRRFELALMLLVPLAALLYSGNLMSLTRIMMPLPALAIGFSELANSEAKRTAWLVCSAAVLALLTLCWSRLITLGMA